MSRHAFTTSLGILALALSVETASAQSQRIPIRKDAPSTTTTSATTTTTTTTTSGPVDWTGPLGYTLRPGAAPVYCAPEDVAEVAKISIKTDAWVSGMISPEQAKAIALCAVPGQLSSGDIKTADGRPAYEIMVLPTRKQTTTRVNVDAYTGEVINAKQFGGLRGLAGYMRESLERKQNKRTP